MNYIDVVPRVERLVPTLSPLGNRAGQEVLKIALDVSRRPRIGRNMQSFADDATYRAELGGIVRDRTLFCSRSLAILHLADALLADLSGNASAFSEAMEDADRALAMLGY